VCLRLIVLQDFLVYSLFDKFRSFLTFHFVNFSFSNKTRNSRKKSPWLHFGTLRSQNLASTYLWTGAGGLTPSIEFFLKHLFFSQFCSFVVVTQSCLWRLWCWWGGGFGGLGSVVKDCKFSLCVFIRCVILQ